MADRYWMNTTGADCIFSTGCFTTVEKISEPAGEIQTLDPRPRPATWTVAVAVNPCGSSRRSFVFLELVRKSQRQINVERHTFRGLCLCLSQLHHT